MSYQKSDPAEAAILNIEDSPQETSSSQLQFQDFVPTSTVKTESSWQKNDSQEPTYTNYPLYSENEEDNEYDELLGSRQKLSGQFWKLEFYQSFFDVDSKKVGERVLWSMVPRPSTSYLQHYIRPHPDLYGPFWICVTLIFCVAITGNIANYLQTAAEGKYIWKYDFHKVTIAGSTIFAYAWIIPVVLWGIMRWRKSPIDLTFIEILCVYGYSLSIYIPISILWLIQIGWLQWLWVIIGSVMSGTVLVLTFWPAVKDDNKKVAFGFITFLVLAHFVLAAGFMLYFFHVPSREIHNLNETSISGSPGVSGQLQGPKEIPPSLAPLPKPSDEVKKPEEPAAQSVEKPITNPP